MKIIRLDIDDYKYSKDELIELFFNIPKPFMIRRSGNNRGYHIKFKCPFFDCVGECYDCYVYGFDDEKRRILNKVRKKEMLTHNVLWDIKAGQKAIEWEEIGTYNDYMKYIEKYGIIYTKDCNYRSSTYF